MKIYTLSYSEETFPNWANLGDDIQSIAAARLLPRVDGHISREHLQDPVEPGILSMNGFFMGEGQWPPHPSIEPLFFAFHVTPSSAKKIFSPEGVAYLKKHQPIGCRDRGTLKLMQDHGIEAFYSKCVTLTLPRRESEPKNGRIYMVGLSEGAKSTVPRAIRKQAVTVDQAKLRVPDLGHALKAQISQHLLDTYRRTASLVITSKIHAAMPCIAMGIPVVFLYDKSREDDYRVSIIQDLIGIQYVGESKIDRLLINQMRQGKIDWSPKAADIEAEKLKIKTAYLEAFERAAARFLARG
jgi:hypothetical protein